MPLYAFFRSNCYRSFSVKHAFCKACKTKKTKTNSYLKRYRICSRKHTHTRGHARTDAHTLFVLVRSKDWISCGHDSNWDSAQRMCKLDDFVHRDRGLRLSKTFCTSSMNNSIGTSSRRALVFPLRKTPYSVDVLYIPHSLILWSSDTFLKRYASQII